MEHEELIARQRALQLEAGAVARELRVEETLAHAGRVVLVGSAVTGLMVWRDLDVVVDAPRLSPAGAFETMLPLLACCHAARYEYDTDLDRHYFVLRARGAGQEWKLDVSIFVAGVPREIESFQAELPARLTEETRLAVLLLKDAWYEDPAYPDVVGGYEIYDAVLNHGARTLAELDAYLQEHGLPTRTPEPRLTP